MRKKLYHFTSNDSWLTIKRDGSIGVGGRKYVWMTPAPSDAMGESSRQILVEVVVDAPKSVFDRYRKDVVIEEADENAMAIKGGHRCTVVWYSFPPAILKWSVRSLRQVDRTERSELV